MKTYAQKSSAVRAAKKAHGEDFQIIDNPDGSFSFAAKNPVAPAPELLKQIETIKFLSEQEAAIALKAEKKAEIESRKPPFIPAAPSHELVAEIPTPPSAQSLPAFLIPSPPAESAVPEFVKVEKSRNGSEVQVLIDSEADRLANAQAINKNPMDAKVCPCCGSDELYVGEAPNGVVINENVIIGCHHCDWHVDMRKHVVKTKFSTCDKPTKKVWHIADEMLLAVGNDISKLSRKEVQEECVRRGIAYGTARTQFQHWFKCFNDSQAAPIATIGKDGKIVPPSK